MNTDEGESNAELGARFRVTARTIKRWRTKGAPLHDEAKMAAWALTQQNLPQGFLDYIRRSRGAGGDSDVEWKAFLAQSKKDEGGAPSQSLESLMRARDFSAFRFMEGAKRNDQSEMKFFADLLSTFDGVIHDAQLRAKKLGIDAGELLPRPEVERIVFAIAHWLLRSTDQHLEALTSKLKALAPGLEAEPVRAVLEPELLGARFLEPFARAAKMQSGVSLPDWLVAKMRESCGDFLEDGEKQFDEFKGP